MLEEFVTSIGLRGQLASIRTTRLTGDEIAANPATAMDGLVRECEDAVQRDGAEVVILGWLGLAGIAEHVNGRILVPVLDSVVEAVKAAEKIAHTETGAVASASPVFESAGLSVALAAFVRGQ